MRKILFLVLMTALAFASMKRLERKNSGLPPPTAEVSTPLMANPASTPASATPASAPPTRTDRLMTLARHLDQAGRSDVTSVNREIEDLIAGLTTEEAQRLQEVAVNTSETHNARYLAVYALSQRAQEFAPQLEAIGRSSNPALVRSTAEAHSLNELQTRFELALHIEALTALDRLSAESSREQNFFADLQADRSTHPYLRELARVGARGVARHEAAIGKYLRLEP